MFFSQTDTEQRDPNTSYFMKFVFHKIVIGSLLICYFLVLSVLYEKYISPIYGYRGFTIDRDPHKFGIAIITILLVSIFFNVNRKPSSMILYFYLIFMMIPQMSFSYNSNGYAQVMIFSGLVYFVLLIFSHTPMNFVTIHNINFEKYEKYFYLFIGLVMAYTVYVLGYDQFSFRIDDVYKRRELLEHRYDNLLANIIGICFILIVFMSILKAKHLGVQVIIPIILGLVFFGLTGHKRFAIIPLACVIIYKLVALDPKYGFYAVILSILSVGMYYVIVDVEYVNVLENYEALFFTMFFARALAVPAQLNDLYYDFFSQNGLLFWSYSKVGLGFVQYESDWSPAQTIGRHMFTEGSANTGMIGSGYMNAGVTGVVIYAVITGLTMAFVDRVAALRRNRALYTMLALPSFMIIFTTSDLPNVYLTHGFGMILLMMWLFQINNRRAVATNPNMRSAYVPPRPARASNRSTRSA